MATSSTDDTPDPTKRVHTILKHNPALATAAYNRTSGYRQKIQHILTDKYDYDISYDQIQTAILDANRLGLLNKWATTDE